MNLNLKQWVPVGLLAVYLVFLCYYALSNPLYTWDTVPYIASMFADDISSLELLHSTTYSYLEEHLAPEQFSALISGSYASDMFANAEHFNSQLNMYAIKPAYIIILKSLTFFGIDPLTALALLSLIPGVLICVLLFHWLSSDGGRFQALLLVLVFSVSARLIDLSRVPVPDNFSALVTMAGLYALIAKQWFKIAVTLLCLSVLIRTNNILFVGLLFCWQSWVSYRLESSWKGKDFLIFGIGFVMSALVYFVISNSFDYQWWRLFYHTFIESQVDIDTFSEPFATSLYLPVVQSALLNVLASGAFIATSLPFYLLLFFIVMGGKWQSLFVESINPPRLVSLGHIAALCLPVFGVFLLFFPLAIGWDRFFLPYYGLILIFAVKNSRMSKLGSHSL